MVLANESTARIEVLDDFDKELKPRSKSQETFAAAGGEIKELGFGGAAGGAKTFSLVADPLFKKCHEIMGFQMAIFRRTYPQIRESVEIESMKWYPKFGFKYNNTEHVWTRKVNGQVWCTIRFIHAEEEKSVFAHDSAAYDILGFEETTQFTEFMYRYLFHRNRPNVANWKPYTRAVATPGDIGNTWYRERFVVPGGVNGYKVIHARQEDGKFITRMFIPSFAKDNPVLMARDPNYITNLLVLPEALKKAKLYGDWWAFQGQVFTEFRAYNYPDEPPNALHVIEPFFDPQKPPRHWQKIIAIDPGYRHFTWVGWGVIHPVTKQLIIYREYMCKETDIKIWGPEIKALSQHDGIISSKICDTAAWAEEGMDTSIIEQIQAATGWSFNQSVKDRIGGKMLIHELLRWKPRPKSYDPISHEKLDMDYANKLYRINGKEAFEVYISKFMPEYTEEILPKLLIFNTCPNLINAIQSVVYDEKKVEDVKKQDGDDPYDGVRYLAQEYVKLIKGEIPDELKREIAIQNAQAELERTGDWNDYYRQMALLENSIGDVKEVLDAIGGRRIGTHRRVIVH